MACPPGYILNPHTLRCIHSRGRIAQELVKAGDIDAGELRFNGVPTRYRRRRQTMRFPQQNQYQYPYEPAAAAQRPALLYDPMAAAQPYQWGGPAPVRPLCPPGTQENPATGRCIRVGGRTFKRVYGDAAAIPKLAPFQPPVARPPPPPPPAPMGRVPTERVFIPPAAPATVTTAKPAPQGDRRSVLTWAATNCRNSTDPLTRIPFTAASADSLQELLRLHDGTCTFATPLNNQVMQKYKIGQIPPIPGSADRTPMTLEDFTALRDTMRRHNPAYKLPAHRHTPPPPEWRLYAASDAQSGPDYLTVGFVDTTKSRRTQYGIQYPPDAFRVQMGFLPVVAPRIAGCTIQDVISLLRRLADANKLLVPTAGGWRPIAGFPFTKADWEGSYRAQRLGRLCKDLARALATSA